MSRNRDETRQRILEAALDIVAEDGFAALGINAVARRAGADKQLIYRYFGGLDQLMADAGAEVAHRMAKALEDAVTLAPTYGALIEGLAGALLRYLLDDRLYRPLRLMEASAPTPTSEAFRAARGKVLAEWMQRARGDLTPPSGVDPAAVNAIIIAAVEGIAILGPAGIAREEVEARLIPALLQLIRAAYGNDGAEGA